MNRAILKKYAPEARRDFIRAVTDRASYYGFTKNKIELATVQGDTVVVGGRVLSEQVGRQRKQLEERIKRLGFDQVMEAMAYTWFNRLVAIRFMELHGYLDHGYRVLSHPDGTPTPEILEKAEHVDLPGLDKQQVITWKLEGNRESELYRLLLIAQCNALHKAMPFLFEWIDDETELLLPDNLLHSDSLIRKLVDQIPEEDWREVEIIGWLYQFYISEKKDEVIGKVVKSEDIPAATQLFTPNWIVKYLVQNSLGRQWMATYPDSPLKGQMEYYIEPAEQTPEVQEQLTAITPESLNPEELTLLDPACGSGHILVEAYDLLKAIYQERGYRAKDIPRLILEKNLYGLEIDDRAAQLAAFALMMKARADDQRIFDGGVDLHVLSIQESKGLDAREITEALNQPIFQGEAPPPESLFEELDDDKTPLFSRKHLSEPGQIPLSDVAELIKLFEHGKTFGSLVQVPEKLIQSLPAIAERVETVLSHGGMIERTEVKRLEPFVTQARVLGRKYDAVVANPPYMGSQGMNPLLKAFAKTAFPSLGRDLFAMSMQRLFEMTRPCGSTGLMTPFTWMFLSSYESLRVSLVRDKALLSVLHPEYHSFFESAYVPICAFVVLNSPIPLQAEFIRLCDFYGEDLQPRKTLEAIRAPECGWRYTLAPQQFSSIPGTPFVYWIGKRMLDLIQHSEPISSVCEAKQGLATADNDRFLRRWFEVDIERVTFHAYSRSEAVQSGCKWFPYNKGGEFRRWFGNREFVVNWESDGREIEEFRPRSVIRNLDYYFRSSISWSDVTVANNAFRFYENGFIFDACAHSAFVTDPLLTEHLLAYLNCSFVSELAKLLNPTMHFHVGYFNKLPMPTNLKTLPIDCIARRAMELSRVDWDSHELSWEFQRYPPCDWTRSLVRERFESWNSACEAARSEIRTLEEENNRLFIEAYGLQDELSPEVPDDQITLYRPSREEDIKRIISYAIGCMMGRYSLDKPGLIYAHSGNQGFDPSQYETFPADDDGIIPITDYPWFEDDAARRLEKFIATAWSKDHLEENLPFVGESIDKKRGESPRDTIRRYLMTDFYKHHLSIYKRRPIYWQFSSGKQRAFQCLVYLHRYHEGTLARMRTEYVIPLSGMMASRIEQLAGDIAAAASTAHRKKLEKEREKLLKQREEILHFDEKLRHYADLKIKLDLDDGVKVNYGKFGDLLAEVKAVCGKKEEE